MKKIDFSYNGGLPFDQPILDMMQSSYFDILASFVGFMKIPSAGNHVLFGCQISEENITPGMMYIDGELCPFSGSLGNGNTKIKKLVTITNAPFLNGTNNPIYRLTTAVVDVTGSALSSYSRYSDSLVFDANYVHTDNNFTNILLQKLNGIAAGAEVNVQTDWNNQNPESDGFLKNKPIIETILRKGEVVLGDFPGGLTQAVSIVFPSVGTTNYKVRVTFQSLNGLNNRGQDLIAWSTADYRHDRFELLAGEIHAFSPNHIQNLKVYYDIIAL